MAFLLIFFFFTSNGGDQQFIFFGTATLWWTLRILLTYFWDHWHFYSDQCYKKALDYYKNATGSEEVNTRGAGKGLSMFPGCVLTVRGGVWTH